MSKPNYICELQKDRLIDGQPGFVDTFNWVSQFVANLKGEDYVAGDADSLVVEIVNATTDHPVLKVKGEGGRKYKSGEHSNVVISESPDSDGFYTIDVYYK